MSDGSIALFEKSTKELYQFKKQMPIGKGSHALTHITLSPDGDHLLCTTSSGQVAIDRVSIENRCF